MRRAGDLSRWKAGTSGWAGDPPGIGQAKAPLVPSRATDGARRGGDGATGLRVWETRWARAGRGDFVPGAAGPLECSASRRRALGLLSRHPHGCWVGTGRGRVRGGGSGLCLDPGHRGDTRMAGLLQGLGRKESQRQPCSAQAEGERGSISADPGAVPSGWPGQPVPPVAQPAAGLGAQERLGCRRGTGGQVRTRWSLDPGAQVRGPDALARPLARPSLGLLAGCLPQLWRLKPTRSLEVGTVHPILHLRKWEIRDIN